MTAILKALFLRLVSGYSALYTALCGSHPSLRPWHFQWHGTARLNRRLKTCFGELEGRVLDFGCGSRPYRGFFRSGVEHVGVDIESRGDGVIAVAADARLPFDDDSFDAVVSTQVFEHVENTDSALSELYRVLRPGGRLVLSVPFIFALHGRPHDYRRFSEFGARQLVAAFVVEHVYPVGGVGGTLAVLSLNWIDEQVGQQPLFWLVRATLLPLWLVVALLVNLFAVLLDALDSTGSYYGAVVVTAMKPASRPEVGATPG